MTLMSRLKTTGQERLGPLLAERQPRRKDFPLSQFGLTNADGVVSDAHGVPLLDVANTFGTPVHVLRSDALDANAHAAFAPCLAGTGADVFYSYKTNPVPSVLEQIHRRGIGAEVISAYEYWLARKLGVPGERIIYNGPAKSAESLADAIGDNAYLINANSTGEMASIAAQATYVGRSANVGIRVSLPGMWAGQFGLASHSGDLIELVRRTREISTLDLKALHFHRGVSIRRHDEVDAYLQDIIAFIDYLGEQTGWFPEIIDVGGSLSCPTSDSISTRDFRLNRALATDVPAPDPENCASVADMAIASHTRLGEHFRQRGLPEPQVVLEPGRALVADTHLILTSVLDVKSDGDIVHLVTDAGTNIAESVTNEFHQLFNVSNIGAPPDGSYRIAGPICTPADVIYNNWRMAQPQVGDVLAIMDTGAYCIPFSTSFSFPRPPIVALNKGEATVIRRRETFDDLVARDLNMHSDIAR